MDEIRSIVQAALYQIIPSIGPLAGVPNRTGRLQSAIKIRPTEYGFDIYIDDGGISEEQWNALTTKPFGIAPYADKVNQRTSFWRRVAVTAYDRLKLELNDRGPTRYDPGLTARGGSSGQ
jgi:hypothetical protein